MMSICSLFNEVQNTPTTTGKKQLLKENLNELVCEIFKDTYGEQKYYVKKLSTPITEGGWTIDSNYNEFHSLLDDLANRKVTGNEAVTAVENILSKYTFEDQTILMRIVDRNLKIGVSIDNFNSIAHVFDKFEVALAMNLDKVTGVNPIDGSFLVSRKCDGVRCATIVEKNGEDIKVEFRSRQNKLFTTLDNLIEPIKKLSAELWKDGKYVFDGEICVVDENGDENFNKVMREVTRKNYTMPYPHYKIFDLVTWDEFVGQSDSLIFSERYNILKQMELFVPSKYYSVLIQERVDSQEVLDRWMDKVRAGSWEGLMLRKDSPFKSGRTKDLLKIKKFKDAEYIVEDVIEGRVTYNEDGQKEFDVISALVINHKGTKVEVGSGLSKEQRINWYKHPELILGKTITVQYFEETVNKKDNSKSLRFPVLKYVYDNGRNV